MVDADHFADGPPLHDFHRPDDERIVQERVADAYELPGGLGSGCNTIAVLHAGGQRFFDDDVAAARERLDGVGGMSLRRRQDVDHVGSGFQQIGQRGKALGTVNRAASFRALGIGVGHSHEVHVGKAPQALDVELAYAAGADKPNLKSARVAAL